MCPAFISNCIVIMQMHFALHTWRYQAAPAVKHLAAAAAAATAAINILWWSSLCLLNQNVLFTLNLSTNVMFRNFVESFRF